MSEIAWRALERVALSMGAREGTEPEDDQLMRSPSTKARAESRAQGLMDAMAQILEARGIGVTPDGTEDRELLAGVPGDALMAAALVCTDATDFRRQVLAQRGR